MSAADLVDKRCRLCGRPGCFCNFSRGPFALITDGIQAGTFSNPDLVAGFLTFATEHGFKPAKVQVLDRHGARVVELSY